MNVTGCSVVLFVSCSDTVCVVWYSVSFDVVEWTVDSASLEVLVRVRVVLLIIWIRRVFICVRILLVRVVLVRVVLLRRR